MRLIFFLFILMFTVVQNSVAAEIVYSDIYNVQYVKNYDGDTLTVNIQGIPLLFGDHINIRIAGIDTPEKKGKCDKEKSLARVATYHTGTMLKNAKVIELRNPQRGKYFRIVADVYADNINVGQELLKLNLAVPYDGGTKTKDWCID